MRTRSTFIVGGGFLVIALLLATSQLSAGEQRPLLGILLAVPWGVAGVAIMTWPRIGKWLGAGVAGIALAASVWIAILAGGGQGRPIAEQLFAAADGSFSWAGVAITSALYALAFACALGAAMWLVLRQRPVR